MSELQRDKVVTFLGQSVLLTGHVWPKYSVDVIVLT